jgi:hypothetical protein
MAAPHQFSETALALELVKKHGDNFRYVLDTAQFLHWNGSIWEPDHEAKKIAQFVTPICCDAAERVIQANPKKDGLMRSLESYKHPASHHQASHH